MKKILIYILHIVVIIICLIAIFFLVTDMARSENVIKQENEHICVYPIGSEWWEQLELTTKGYEISEYKCMKCEKTKEEKMDGFILGTITD